MCVCVCLLGATATNQNEKSLCFLHPPEDQITFFFCNVKKKKKMEAMMCEQVVCDST